MRILIIADDLTGAADSAVQFRQAGFSAIVLADPPGPRAMWHRAQVTSISLNSRDASPATVARIWERHASTITAMAQGALVYQKIDSTLRGHPAREVRLLLGYLGASAALIAPAFPKLGRQTIDGVHRVYGVPLAETEYAHSRTRARASSRLPELFSVNADQSPVHLPLQIIEGGTESVIIWLQQYLNGPPRLITADAADERHLDILAQAALPHVGRLLLVGSAGWAERLALAWKGLVSIPPARPGALGLVGSLSAVATRQVRAVEASGLTVVQFPPTLAESAADAFFTTCQTLTNALAAGRHAVVWTNPGDGRSPSQQPGSRVLRALGGMVRELLSATAVSGLTIVGGDTVHAVFRALRTSGLTLAGEVATGVPYGRLLDGPWVGLLTATKAGGFGSDLALRDCLEFLHRQAGQFNR